MSYGLETMCGFRKYPEYGDACLFQNGHKGPHDWELTMASREFETGATRNQETNKPDYEGFCCPLVKKRFGTYMHKHRKKSDGTLRASDNWILGIPKSEYIKSADRHFTDWHLHHRGYSDETVEELEDSLCAILFNVQGYLHELLKEKRK